MTVAKSDVPHACAAAARTCDEALLRVFGFLGKRWNGVLIAALADWARGNLPATPAG